MDDDSSVSDYIIGILLVVIGQLASGVHITVEEKYLKEADFHPVFLVGAEGTIGLIVMAGICLPIVSSISGSDCGKVENVLDGFKMMSQDYFLLGLFLGAYIAVVFYVSLMLVVCIFVFL